MRALLFTIALLAASVARAPAQAPPSPFPRESEASDKAWEQQLNHGACSRLRNRLSDTAADKAACTAIHTSRPLCVDYRSWAWVWFDLADDKTFDLPAGKRLFEVQSDVIEALGMKSDPWDPFYYKMPDYKRQLRRILEIAVARPNSWRDHTAISEYVYERCMKDLAEIHSR
jgi:hypothetical protein